MLDVTLENLWIPAYSLLNNMTLGYHCCEMGNVISNLQGTIGSKFSH